MTTFRRIIENQINNLEDLASIENNEGRWVDEEKYIFAKECLENLLENLLSNEAEIRAEERRKFVEWLANGNTFIRRIGTERLTTIDEIISEYEKEHTND